MIWSVPSKTFLVGEYIALQGETSLVLNTEPRFLLQIEKSPQPEGLIDGISIESPAGKFLRSHSEAFCGWHLRFSDPHQGAGGLGASTAQFAMCYLFYQWRKDQEILEKGASHWRPPFEQGFIEEMLANYWQVSWSGEGAPPSGADLCSQIFMKNIADWRRRDFRHQGISWPFENHGFLLLRTGIKEATHLHLQELEDFDTRPLVDAAEITRQALINGELEGFSVGIQGFRHALAEQNLTCKETLDLLRTMDDIPEVLCAKGCGALGADVLFVLAAKKDLTGIAEFWQKRNLSVIATHEDLSPAFSREASS